MQDNEVKDLSEIYITVDNSKKKLTDPSDSLKSLDKKLRGPIK
jgi:hypothetical protein